MARRIEDFIKPREEEKLPLLAISGTSKKSPFQFEKGLQTLVPLKPLSSIKPKKEGRISLVDSLKTRSQTTTPSSRKQGLISGALDVTKKVGISAGLDIAKAAVTGIRLLTQPKEERRLKIDFSKDSAIGKFETKLDELINKPLNKIAREQIDLLSGEQRKIAKSIADEKPGLSSFNEYLFEIERGAVSLAEAIGITLLTKNTSAAAGVLSFMESSDVYNDAREQGLSHQKALNVASVSGIGTFFLEKIGLDYLFAVGGGAKLSEGFTKFMFSRGVKGLKSSIFETAQEELQTVWQNIVRKVGVDETQKIFEGWYETAVGISVPSFIAGMILPGGSLQSKNDIISRMIRDGATEDQAETAWQEMLRITGESLEEFREQTKGKAGLTIEDVSKEEPIKPKLTKKEITPVKEEVTKEAGIIEKAQEDFKRAEEEVFTELDISEKGQRLFGEEGEGFIGVQKSTFPEYISPELRSKKLFNSVVSKIEEGKELKGSKEIKLKEEIEQAIFDKMAPELANEKLASDFIQELETKKDAETNKVVKSIEQGIIDKLTSKRFSLVQVQKAKTKAKIQGFKLGEKQGVRIARDNITKQLRDTQQNIDQSRKDIITFAKENLPLKERGKLLTLVSTAKTQKQLTKAFGRMYRAYEQSERLRLRDEIKKVYKRILKSPSVAVDYKTQAKEIIPFLGTATQLNKARKLAKFAESQPDNELPLRLAKTLEMSNKSHISEIPLKHVESILDELLLLEQLGRLKVRTSKNLYNIEKQRMSDAVNKDVTPIEKHKEIKVLPGERLSMSQKFKNFLTRAGNQANRIDKIITPIDAMIDIFDGGKGTYDGANYTLFKKKQDYNFGKFLDLKDSSIEKVEEESRKFKVEQFEKIGFVAAREQEGGREKLHNLGFTDKEIDSVQLTKEEDAFLKQMQSDMDAQFPHVQKLMKDVFNEDVKKVKNYFSFMTDFKAMEEEHVVNQLGFDLKRFGDTATKKVKKDFTISRKGAGKQKIKLNALEIYEKHMENVAYLRTMARDIQIAFEVANTSEFKESHGELGQALMIDWLDVMARKGGADGARQIAAVDWMRKNLSAGVLGLKLSSAAIQWTALVDGMGMIGTGYGIRGVNNIVTSKEWRQFLVQFPELRDRIGGETALRELVDGNWFQKLQQKGFIPLQTMDKITASAVVSGAYERKMVELGLPIDLTGKPNEEALAYAELVLRRTQSTSLFKDVPLTISRGSLTGNRSLDRSIFQFQNFLLTRWSRVRHDAIRAGINTRDPGKAAAIMFFLLIASLLATGTRMAVYRTIDFLTGDDDERDNVALKSFLFELAGTVPFMGNITAAFMYDSNLIPIIETPKDIMSGLKRTITGKKSSTKLKGLNDFLTSVGVLTGVPGSTQVQQLVRKSLREDAQPSGGSSQEKVLRDLGLPSLSPVQQLPKLPGLPAL